MEKRNDSIGMWKKTAQSSGREYYNGSITKAQAEMLLADAIANGGKVWIRGFLNLDKKNPNGPDFSLLFDPPKEQAAKPPQDDDSLPF